MGPLHFASLVIMNVAYARRYVRLSLINTLVCAIVRPRAHDPMLAWLERLDLHGQVDLVAAQQACLWHRARGGVGGTGCVATGWELDI